MSDWIATGKDGNGAVAHAMRGTALLGSARGADAVRARDTLDFDTARVVQIGDGAPDTVPCAVLPQGGTRLPALTQTDPPDVISAWVRLWIAGFLAARPNWDGVVCVTHGDVRHWCHASAGEVVSCQSTLTPQLVVSLDGTMPPDQAALADSLSRPERLAAHLRAAQVTGNSAAIAGHLIGAELAAARPYWLGQEVVLIAPDSVASGLGPALEAQAVPVRTATPDSLLADGLAALAAALDLTD